MNIRCVELHSFTRGQFFLRCDEPMDDEDPIEVRLLGPARQLKAWKRIDLKHSRQELYNAMDEVCKILDVNDSEAMAWISIAFSMLLR